MERDSSTSTVLLVEDESIVLMGVTQAMKSAGISVIACAGALEAVEQVRTHREIALVVSDVRMPDIDGFELVRRVRSMRDDLPILLISGDPSVGTDDAHTSSMGCTLLRKPVTRQELLAAVTGLLSVRGAVREPSMLSWRGSPL